MSEQPESQETEVTETDAGEQQPAPAAAQQTAQPVVPAEPAPVLSPKERRQRAREAKAAPARSHRTPEQRQAARTARRAAKAQARRAERRRGREKARARRTDTAATPPREHAPSVQKVRQGIVVSDRADKTITVRIDTARRHRRYQKIVRTSRTLHAHDESNDAHIGDTVIVRESRPLSRTKHWRLIQVVERAE